MNKGDVLLTPFGQGAIHQHRETDDMYVVQLPYATLYAKGDSIQQQQQPFDDEEIQAMELNVAYESLEQMRKLNLEVECQQRGIPCNNTQCTTCLLATPPTKMTRFPRFHKLVHNHVFTPTSNCLSCGSPVCFTHSSSQFRKESLSVCLLCEKLFTLDFVVECMTASNDIRKKRIHHMVDVYDRILLLLKYSQQFIPQVIWNLQESTVVQNKVGIGSSSAGIVSGVLGVAAAATILTPAGPPLLIASLLFSGSATAVQTGTEVRNYYSPANQLADRMLALNGMLQSILKVTSTLRDALLRDYLRTDGVDETIVKQYDDLLDMEKHKGTLLAGLTVSRAGAASVELSALATAAEVGAASRSARFITRGSTGILRTARLARFAGGALSAATLLFETKCMSDTIQNICAGNPCEKAELLEVIQSEIQNLPTTSDLDHELQSYVEGLAQRERRMTEAECVRLILDASKLEDYEEDDEDGSIVFVESSGTPTTVQSDDLNSVSSSGGSSLLERIERFKKKDSDEYYPESRPIHASLFARISMYKNNNKRHNVSSGRLDDSPDSVPVATLG